jgi:hypothetical protein
LFWFVVVLIGSIAGMLFVQFLARSFARAKSAQAMKRPVAVSASPRPAPGPPGPQEVALAAALPLVTLPVVVPERRTRRLHLADARTGILLGTILGPCRAHQSDADDRV